MPSYAQLPDGDAAGVFGPEDRLGCLNHLTPERALAAARLVTSGAVFSLNAPIDWPDPPLFGRRAPSHFVLTTPTGNRDDYLDHFYLQGSSQWDSFRHIQDPDSGFYNGHPETELGIDNWACRGIVGRGVLLDVERHRADIGRPLAWDEQCVITVEDLEACGEAQGVTTQTGDILLIRTGWAAGYRGTSETERQRLGGTQPPSPGLEGSERMAAHLWDLHIAAVAADNPALEAIPLTSTWIHPRLIARLGIPIGELWWLDELADACAADRRYEFLFTSAPLNLRGGVGSPANALAIR